MGESDRYLDYKRQRRMRLGDDNNALVTLFAINGVLFLLLLLIQVSYSYSERSGQDFYNEVFHWFTLPGSFTAFIRQPWSLLTYMFSDSGLSGLAIVRFASNMIWLWGFGSLFQQIAGNDKLIPVYLYGGLLGGILFVAVHSLMPSLPGSAGLFGANTGVMAIAMAATITMPGYRFFQQLGGGIPLWVLMGIYILIDLSSPLKSGDTAYCIAHIGGAVAGFLYIILLRNGTDAGAWMHKSYQWLVNLYKPKIISKDKIREKVFYETNGRKPFTKTAHVTQQRIDEILDKISMKGYDYLTKEEKDILKKASEDENL
ncbi:MAG: rhomboid family intramembrane serine protease [Ferruginibacter sp.]